MLLPLLDPQKQIIWPSIFLLEYLSAAVTNFLALISLFVVKFFYALFYFKFEVILSNGVDLFGSKKPGAKFSSISD